MPIETLVRLARGPLLAAAADVGADAVAVLVSPGPDGPVFGRGAVEVAESVGFDLAALMAQERGEGEAGEAVAFPVPMAGRILRGLLVGVGERSPEAYRAAGAALSRRARGRRTLVAPVPEGDDDVEAFVEGLLLASYAFSLASTPPGGPEAVESVTLATYDDATDATRAVDRATVVSRAVALARDLVNTPSNVKDPEWLAARAEEAGTRAGLCVRVRREDDLAAEGFGGILAVGQGSVRPPRLVELTYTPERPRDHVICVGKGITFDSGGLSLKSGAAMRGMKGDMAGAAAIIAALSALRDLGVDRKVTGLVAAAENLPSGSAQRPGDVITHYGGRTVEVLNTDAEGRLVLADALGYACALLAPDAVIDLATLTGAARTALGRSLAAVYSTDDALADALVDAGRASGDRLWRMPLVDDYRPALDSHIADLVNVARDGDVGAGSIVAALFLREFAGDRAWAHVDMAATADVASDSGEHTRGATGFGVRLLLRWLVGGAR